MGLFLIGILLFIVLLVLGIIALIIFLIVRAVKRSNNNNSIYSNIVATNAVVIAKRVICNAQDKEQVRYFITFEFETGAQMELETSGSVYDRISENEKGWLNFQGNRFLEFERF